MYCPCPYLGGTKDALCHKFRRLTISQNCSAICTNGSGHKYAILEISNEWCEVQHVLRGLLSRPLSLDMLVTLVMECMNTIL